MTTTNNYNSFLGANKTISGESHLCSGCERVVDRDEAFMKFLGCLMDVVNSVSTPLTDTWGIVYCDLLHNLNRLEKLMHVQEAYNLQLARESVDTARSLVDAWAKRNVAAFEAAPVGVRH